MRQGLEFDTEQILSSAVASHASQGLVEPKLKIEPKYVVCQSGNPWDPVCSTS